MIIAVEEKRVALLFENLRHSQSVPDCGPGARLRRGTVVVTNPARGAFFAGCRSKDSPVNGTSATAFGPVNCVSALDEATSVVWSMPKAEIDAGAACDVLAIDQMAHVVTARLGG